jgi:ribosomal protein S18 acetylase RimI-like enzyme
VDRTEVAIRAAQVGDLPGIQAVAETAWAVAYRGIIPEEIQRRLLDAWYSAPALTRALGATGSIFLVAEEQHRLVGFAQFARRSAEAAELTRIYVRPDLQHHGIGTRLLEVGLAELARQGVHRLTVQVERDNAAGRRFYRSRGFAEAREFSQEVEGHSLQLVECQRDVDGPVQRPA